MIDTYYDSESGTRSYRYSVEFIDSRTGKVILTTTDWLWPSSTVLLFYNSDNPTEVRFDYGRRFDWLRYFGGQIRVSIIRLDVLLLPYIIAIATIPVTPYTGVDEKIMSSLVKKSHFLRVRNIVFAFIALFIPGFLII